MTSKTRSWFPINLLFGWFLLFFFPVLACQERVDKELNVEPGGNTLEEEIVFQNGSTRLAGTLVWPNEKKAFAGVVILAGSDRGARGLRRMSLARELSLKGVASLVYDSPGTGASSGSAGIQTDSDRVSEAQSAVQFLKTLKEIPPGAVGLLGGSEGANIALKSCDRGSGVGFVIAVSSALGVSILDILRYSAEKKGYQNGLADDEILKAITFKETAFALFSGVNIVEWSLVQERVKDWRGLEWRNWVLLAKQRTQGIPGDKKMDYHAAFKATVAPFMGQPWFSIVDPGNRFPALVSLDVESFFRLLESGRYALDWDRSLCAGLVDITCPVLAIWGEEDSFLPPNQSAERLKTFLEKTNHPDYETRIVPNANHFLTMPKSPSEFSKPYIEMVVTWLEKHFKAIPK